MIPKVCLMLVAATVLSACSPKQLDETKSDDGWDTPPPAAQAPASSTPAPAGSSSDTTAVAALSESGGVTLLGESFKLDGTSETLSPNSNGSLRIAHYFSASAPFDLPTSITAITSQLEGHTAGTAAPVIGFRITSLSGIYQDHTIPARPIDGRQTLKDSLQLAPGSYKFNISYYTDTGNGARPAITIKQITLK